MSADKLAALLKACKCGVYLTVNQHRDYYQTAAQALQEKIDRGDDFEIDDATRFAMIDKDTIIELHIIRERRSGLISFCITISTRP